MNNRIEHSLQGWRQIEAQHKADYGKDALKERSFLKIKHAELQRIYRNNRGKARTIQEKISLASLRSGNRNLERRLYPNRAVRWTRRFVRFSYRSVVRVVGWTRRQLRPPVKSDLKPYTGLSKVEAQPVPQEAQKAAAVQQPKVMRMPGKQQERVAVIAKAKGISR